MSSTATHEPLFHRLPTEEDLFSEKIAAMVLAKMPDDEKKWPAQIHSELLRALPYIAQYDPEIVIDRLEAEAGAALGYAQVRNRSAARPQDNAGKGGNVIRIPIIVQDRRLQPFLVFEAGGETYPLTEDRVEQAMLNPNLFDTDAQRVPSSPSLVDAMYPPYQQRQGFGRVVEPGAAGLSKLSSASRFSSDGKTFRHEISPGHMATSDTDGVCTEKAGSFGVMIPLPASDFDRSTEQLYREKQTRERRGDNAGPAGIATGITGAALGTIPAANLYRDHAWDASLAGLQAGSEYSERMARSGDSFSRIGAGVREASREAERAAMYAGRHQRRLLLGVGVAGGAIGGALLGRGIARRYHQHRLQELNAQLKERGALEDKEATVPLNFQKGSGLPGPQVFQETQGLPRFKMGVLPQDYWFYPLQGTQFLMGVARPYQEKLEKAKDKEAAHILQSLAAREIKAGMQGLPSPGALILVTKEGKGYQYQPPTMGGGGKPLQKAASFEKSAFFSVGGGGIQIDPTSGSVPVQAQAGWSNFLGVMPLPHVALRAGNESGGVTIGPTSFGIDSGHPRGTHLYYRPGIPGRVVGMRGKNKMLKTEKASGEGSHRKEARVFGARPPGDDYLASAAAPKKDRKKAVRSYWEAKAKEDPTRLSTALLTGGAIGGLTGGMIGSAGGGTLGGALLGAGVGALYGGALQAADARSIRDASAIIEAAPEEQKAALRRALHLAIQRKADEERRRHEEHMQALQEMSRPTAHHTSIHIHGTGSGRIDRPASPKMEKYQCAYCGTQSSSSLGSCKSCHAPMGEAHKVASLRRWLLPGIEKDAKAPRSSDDHKLLFRDHPHASSWSMPMETAVLGTSGDPSDIVAAMTPYHLYNNARGKFLKSSDAHLMESIGKLKSSKYRNPRAHALFDEARARGLDLPENAPEMAEPSTPPASGLAPAMVGFGGSLIATGLAEAGITSKTPLEASASAHKIIESLEDQGIATYIKQHASPHYNPMGQHIVVNPHSTLSTLAHEAGHATGSRALLGRPYAWGRAYGTVALPAIGVGAATVLEDTSLTANKEEAEKRLKWARVAPLLASIPYAPVLAEEARASIRGVNMIRGLEGGGAAAKASLELLPAFGTYAAATAGPLTAAYLAHRKLQKLRAGEITHTGEKTELGKAQKGFLQRHFGRK
jgi:hypothetical protein